MIAHQTPKSLWRMKSGVAQNKGQTHMVAGWIILSSVPLTVITVSLKPNTAASNSP